MAMRNDEGESPPWLADGGLLSGTARVSERRRWMRGASALLLGKQHPKNTSSDAGRHAPEAVGDTAVCWGAAARGGCREGGEEEE